MYEARQCDLELPVIQSILRSNTYVIERTLKTILGFARRRVGMVGLSFKSNTDDLRESPLVELAERLIGNPG